MNSSTGVVVYSTLPESKARALDNMGRAYAKMGCYKKAINMCVMITVLGDHHPVEPNLVEYV